MKNQTCDVNLVHQKHVDDAVEQLNSIDINTITSIYKILADEKRFKIIYSLLHVEELCVCDISNVINATIATTSHHLQQLKKMNVLDSRKDGKMLYYFLINKDIANLINFSLVNSGADHDKNI